MTFALLWSIVRGVYFLLPFLNIGFLEIAKLLPCGTQVGYQRRAHLAIAANCAQLKQHRENGRWHWPQTQQEVVTHECSQAYPKQILENCCKKIQETREEPPWIRVLHEQTHSTERAHRCVPNDRTHPRGLQQLKQNLDALKGTITRYTSPTRAYAKGDHHDSLPNARLGAHSASLRRGNQADGSRWTFSASPFTSHWRRANIGSGVIIALAAQQVPEYAVFTRTSNSLSQHEGVLSTLLRYHAR